MSNVIPFPKQAVVFTPRYLERLAESNRALRQLRALGCRVTALELPSPVRFDPNREVEVRVDRNPHVRLAGCPHVHVTVARP